MRILVLSFYYKPDLCAGSFRCTALVDALKQHSDCEIEVITTFPNRYASFSADALEKEKNGNVTVHRVALPSHKSGMLDQVRSFLTFYREATKIARDGQYDCVYATSSRLFTAFLGARLAKKKKLPLYLDIRDIFVDTIKDVLPSKIVFIAKPVFGLIEKYTFTQASRINLVSRGFESYFKERFPHADYRWFTNGIDQEFLQVTKGINDKSEHSKLLHVVYAGNLGEGQGLHNILPKLAKLLEGYAEFKVIGDGGRKNELQQALHNQSVTNVELMPPVNRAQLINSYLAADILFLHLNDYPAFKKVLPSKIFEYAAMGKPIWAGVSGYAAEFLHNEVDNVAVFDPGNASHAQKVLDGLTMGLTNRDRFIDKYSRINIMADMAADLVEFASNGENV